MTYPSSILHIFVILREKKEEEKKKKKEKENPNKNTFCFTTQNKQTNNKRAYNI